MATDPNALAAEFIKAQMARNQADKQTMVMNDREDARNREWYNRLDAGTAAKMDMQNNAANVKQQAVDQTGAGNAAMQFALQEFKNPYAAAAYAANMQAESGFNGNVVGDKNLGPGQEAYGRFQWRLDRASNRKAFIAANGGIDDLPTDMRYSIAEMKTKYPQVYQRLMSATSLAEANGAMRQYLGYDNSNGEELSRLSLGAEYMSGKGGGPKLFADASKTGNPDDPDQAGTTNEMSPDGKKIITNKEGVVQSKSVAASVRNGMAQKGFVMSGEVEPGTGGNPTTATFQREVPTFAALQAKYAKPLPSGGMPSYSPGEVYDPNVVSQATLASLAKPVDLARARMAAQGSTGVHTDPIDLSKIKAL